MKLNYDAPLVVNHNGRTYRGTADTLHSRLPTGDYDATVLLDDGSSAAVTLIVSPRNWSRAIDPTERYDAQKFVSAFHGDDPAFPSIPDLASIDDTNEDHAWSPYLILPVLNLLLDQDMHWEFGSDSPSCEYDLSYDVSEDVQVFLAPLSDGLVADSPVAWRLAALDEDGAPIEGADLTLPLSTPPADVAAAAMAILDKVRPTA